jgi:hypothetical protein
MDAERFDRIAKGLRSGSTRRRLLAGVAAVPLALGARSQVAAKEKDPCDKLCKKPCKRDPLGNSCTICLSRC